ncbi:MAG: hypothetical protein LBO74_13700 [Candidatus Symbiothrix sp.]|nr:hypothetical protein [Candidatus Symbiothrix sp.]
MNKRMYFMLSLLLVMTTGLKAQVVIGTNAAEPVASAVLDLNSGIDGNLGLLLPRVALESATDEETIKDPATGLMVYADGTGGLAAGVYVWDGVNKKWQTNGAGGNGVSNPEDFTDIEGGTVSTSYRPVIMGTSCFDVREGQNDPQSQTYTLKENGNVGIASIAWKVEDDDELLNSHQEVGNAQVLVFKDRAVLLSKATPNPVYVTLTAYITYNDDTKYQKSLAIKVMNGSCCPGVLIPNAAFDYADGRPGDAARWGNASSSVDADWNLNIASTDIGVIAAQYVNAGRGLCVVQSRVDQTWPAAIELCRSGSPAGETNTDQWYLPNLAEAAVVHANNISNSSVAFWPITLGTNVNWGRVDLISSDEFAKNQVNPATVVAGWYRGVADGTYPGKSYILPIWFCVKRM